MRKTLFDRILCEAAKRKSGYLLPSERRAATRGSTVSGKAKRAAQIIRDMDSLARDMGIRGNEDYRDAVRAVEELFGLR